MIGKQSIIIKKSLSNNDSLLCGIKTIISMMIAITVIILYTSSLFSVYALHYWASPSPANSIFPTEIGKYRSECMCTTRKYRKEGSM